jgi:hypothetical protein
MATFLALLSILLAAGIHVERERAGPERRDPRRRVGTTREKPEDTPHRGSPRLRSFPSRPATANGGILLPKFGPLSSCRMASAREAPARASKECELTPAGLRMMLSMPPSGWQYAPARRPGSGGRTAVAPCVRWRTWPLICRPASFRGSRPSANEDLSWKPSAPMMILMGEDDDWTPAPPGLIPSIKSVLLRLPMVYAKAARLAGYRPLLGH